MKTTVQLCFRADRLRIRQRETDVTLSTSQGRFPLHLNVYTHLSDWGPLAMCCENGDSTRYTGHYLDMRTRLPADSETQDIFWVHLSVVKAGLTYYYVSSHTPQCNKQALTKR